MLKGTGLAISMWQTPCPVAIRQNCLIGTLGRGSCPYPGCLGYESEIRLEVDSMKQLIARSIHGLCQHFIEYGYHDRLVPRVVITALSW